MHTQQMSEPLRHTLTRSCSECTGFRHTKPDPNTTPDATVDGHYRESVQILASQPKAKSSDEKITELSNKDTQTALISVFLLNSLIKKDFGLKKANMVDSNTTAP